MIRPDLIPLKKVLRSSRMTGSRDLMHTINTNKVLDTQDLDEHLLGCNTPGHTTTVTLQGGPHPGKENLHQTKPIVRALFLSIEMKITLKISKNIKYIKMKLN